MNRNRRLAAAAVGILGMVAGSGLAITPQVQAAQDDGRQVVPNTEPTWVDAATSQGKVADQATSHFRVYLAPHGGVDALKAAVAGVSTPGSSQYGHYLTAAQYHAQYDATSADVSQVSDYLTSQKLQVTSVEAQHRYLDVTGTNAAAEQALGTSISTFKHDGQTVQANTTPVALPTAIAPMVLTVTGLDTTPHLITHTASTPAPPPPGFANGRPCSSYYGQLAAKYKADGKTPLPKFKGKTLPFAVCGYTGPQYRAAYQGANPRGLDGSGVTIAVLDAYDAPTIVSDATTYATRHGDGGYAPGQYTSVTPNSYTNEAACGPSGWFGEQTLDVEAEHAMAPGANIRYYAAKSCFDQDFIDALALIVDQNQVALVSNSWADTEANEGTDSLAAYQQIFLQGAMQGITFTFSSGDDGDEVASSGLRQPVYPASDPYVTAVGGTADAIGADGSFVFQTGWGTENYSLSPNGKAWNPAGFLYGAGGGNSSLFNLPDYQQGVVPSSNGPGRAVPDVAMDADPNTGMLIGETQTFTDGVRYGEYRIGGTSLASPLFAGQAALLMQYNNGARLGFFNPMLYGKVQRSGRLDDIAGTPPDAGNIRVNFNNGENATDGLSYFVRTFNQDSSLAIAPGWDDVTGLGAPNASFLRYRIPPS